MNVWTSILAGIAGTAIMTAFMYAMTFMTKHVMKVVKILGTMLTFTTGPGGRLSESRRASVVGTLAHYAIGIAFALVYDFLWSRGIGRPDLEWALIFGLVSGVVAILIWYAFFAIHPKPPAISLPPYLLTLVVAHIVFALGVVLTYMGLR